MLHGNKNVMMMSFWWTNFFWSWWKSVYWPRTETTIFAIVWDRNDTVAMVIGIPIIQKINSLYEISKLQMAVSAESIASSDVYLPPLKKHKILEKDEALRLRKEYIAWVICAKDLAIATSIWLCSFSNKISATNRIYIPHTDQTYNHR